MTEESSAHGGRADSDRNAVRLDELTEPQIWESVLRAAAGVVVVDALLLGVYAKIPIGMKAELSPWAVFLLVLALFGLALFWQVRGILKSHIPQLRAVVSLFFAIPLFVVLCALVYFSMSMHFPGSFSEPLTRIDAFYFTMTIFSTVGFGDITAQTDLARVAVSVQMFLGLIVLGASVRIVSFAAREGLRRGGLSPH